jgi:hypothetical protein
MEAHVYIQPLWKTHFFCWRRIFKNQDGRHCECTFVPSVLGNFLLRQLPFLLLTFETNYFWLAVGTKVAVASSLNHKRWKIPTRVFVAPPADSSRSRDFLSHTQRPRGSLFLSRRAASVDFYIFDPYRERLRGRPREYCFFEEKNHAALTSF